MDQIKISLSQAGPSGELAIVRADGVVDTITASELENVIESLLGQKKYKILVDLGGVEYISSAGWGIFVSKIQEIRDNDGDIKLVNMIPNVYEIYELLEFEHIIQAYDNLEQGKKAFHLPASESTPGSEKVWKANDRVVSEAGSSIQSAFSPGIRNQADDESASVETLPKTADEVILRLVAEDPFSSIGELNRDATDLAPRYQFGWWKVFGILRRHRLLSRRSRFRLSRRKNKR